MTKGPSARQQHPGGKIHRARYALKGQTLSVHSQGQDVRSEATPWRKDTPCMVRPERASAKRTLPYPFGACWQNSIILFERSQDIYNCYYTLPDNIHLNTILTKKAYTPLFWSVCFFVTGYSDTAVSLNYLFYILFYLTTYFLPPLIYMPFAGTDCSLLPHMS